MDTESTAAEPEAEHRFMDHPEVRQLLKLSLTTVVPESDRGAVLVAASLIDSQLRRLFELLAPAALSRKRLEALLNYPGPLATLAGKTHIAVLCRILTPQLGASIDHLRDIRNAVAHSPDTFLLRDHQATLLKMFDLGPNVPVGINRWAMEIMFQNLFRRLSDKHDPLADPPKPMFGSPMELVEYLLEHPDLIEPLEAQRLRWELAIAVGLVGALVVSQRDRALKVVGGDYILGSLDSKQS